MEACDVDPEVTDQVGDDLASQLDFYDTSSEEFDCMETSLYDEQTDESAWTDNNENIWPDNNEDAWTDNNENARTEYEENTCAALSIET